MNAIVTNAFVHRKARPASCVDHDPTNGESADGRAQPDTR